MPKEVIAAIIVGGMLGMAIAFGVWRANIALSPQTDTPQNQITTNNPSPAPTTTASKLSLTITSPEDELVVTSGTLTVAGLTTPGSIISLSTDKSETIVTADAKGDFNGQVELAEGTNVVTITSFTTEGETIEKQITVVYSTEIKTQQ